MRRHLRTIILGEPLPTEAAGEKRLDRFRALAVLSPDALASVAYANQEIFLGLVVAGAAGLSYAWPIAVVITALLGVLALSYSQTIAAYPSGGGSYTVAHENLGITPGLVAAAALMIDYVLNAAVSLTAGMGAVASAFPALWPYRTVLALVLLLIITVVNLRGLRESGTFMVVPVYLFLVTYVGMVIYGLISVVFQPAAAAPPPAAPPATEALTLFLLLRTFSAGATALTGVEAISNAVSVFRPPEVRHARQTMAAMAILMGVLFLGTIGLIQLLRVVAGPEETILSALARRLFGSGALYLIVQAVTLLMLVVAANTSFAGFPRLSAVLARDGYVPRQLQFLGDRLVFANGILLLAALAGLLIVLFGGDAHRLIPLFAVGAFLAFTLSQTGMTVHWLRSRGPHWLLKTALNGLGATATGAALIIIAATKFVHGAWVVVVLIPLLVMAFRSVREHYNEVGRELHLRETPSPGPARPPRIVVPVAGVHRGVLAALQYACSISREVTAVYVELNPGSGEEMQARWREQQLDRLAPLAVVPSPYRSVVGPLLRYLDSIDALDEDGQPASVLIPEFVPANWWQNALHNQTAWVLRVALLYRRRWQGRGRAIIDLPFYLER